MLKKVFSKILDIVVTVRASSLRAKIPRLARTLGYLILPKRWLEKKMWQDYYKQTLKVVKKVPLTTHVVLGIIKDFEKLALWSFEGNPVSTGLLLTRNYHYIRKNQDRLGVSVTSVNHMRFGPPLLKTKHGVMIVDDKEYPAPQGSVFLCEPKEMHNIRNDSNKSVKIVFIKGEYKPDDKIE